MPVHLIQHQHLLHILGGDGVQEWGLHRCMVIIALRM